MRSDVVLIIETLPLLRQQIRACVWKVSAWRWCPPWVTCTTPYEAGRRSQSPRRCGRRQYFVNPMQFDRPEDLARYPRTLKRTAKS